MIEFFVPGIPATAGSKRGIPFKRDNGKLGVRLVHDSTKTEPWMAVVANEAAKHTNKVLTGPLCFLFTFVLLRPKHHFGTGRNARSLKPSAPMYPQTKPDLTKLVRAAEDAMKGIVWKDDGQVVQQCNQKIYGESAGLVVRVEELQEKRTYGRFIRWPKPPQTIRSDS